MSVESVTSRIYAHQFGPRDGETYQGWTRKFRKREPKKLW